MKSSVSTTPQNGCKTVDPAGLAQRQQVHRSHFVADGYVEKLLRTEGRLPVILKDGRDIPVSRIRIEAVRARWG